MKHLNTFSKSNYSKSNIQNFEEFNEGSFFRGSLKTANFVVVGLKSLARLLTLNWDALKYELGTIPHTNKMIDLLDTFRDSKSFWMKDKINKYKEKYGTDMVDDIKDVKQFLADSKYKSKDKLIAILDSFLKSIEEGLVEDEEFKDTLQGFKNQLLELSDMARKAGYVSPIEYPEDFKDKPISHMSNKELDSEMDKALDSKDIAKAKYIGKHLK